MKIYMITDLEGPALVSKFDQTRDVTPENKVISMKLLTGEINAAVDGILAADPNAEVIVWDGHGSGGIDILNIHPDAKLIMRGPIGAPYYLDESFDALFFVGQHAMAGTPAAPLCHTYSSKTIEYYKINDIEMGEFGCRAAMAGTVGVPTVFIAGDDKAVVEARALIPNIYGAITKYGLKRELAIHLSHQKSCEVIKRTATEACFNIDSIEPYVLDPPYEQEIRVLEGVSIDGYLKAGAEKIDDRTVVFRSNYICDLRI